MQFENGLNAIRERAPAATTGKKFLPQNFSARRRGANIGQKKPFGKRILNINKISRLSAYRKLAKSLGVAVVL